MSDLIESATVETEASQEVETQEVEAQEEETQEERLYANKYQTPDELEKGYAELQKLYNQRYKGFTGAPEEYTLETAEGISEEDLEAVKISPVVQRLMERGKEQGMSNEMLNGIIHDYIQQEREFNTVTLMEEKKKLGEHADERIKNVVDKLNANKRLQSEPDILEAFKKDLRSAASIEALEILLDTNTVMPIGTKAQTGISKEEYEKMRFAVDEKGRRKMLDPEYAKKVRELSKDLIK